MAKCKYCQKELAENGTFCPHCGKDNAEAVREEETVLTEQTAPVEEAPAVEPVRENRGPEIQDGIKATPGKIAAAVAVVVVLLAVLVALLVNGFKTKEPMAPTGTPDMSTVASVAPTEEAVAGTIPADGNPDDETCKGSYTASDDQVKASADTVVATMGEHTLTNGQLQVYYWMEVQNFLSAYGSYAPYFGLDYTQPLDTQVCGVTEGGTWQQYFLSCALQSWQNYQALSSEGDAAGFVLEEQYQQELDSLLEDFESNAVSYGFENAEAFLAYNVGAGASLADYQYFMNLYYPGYFYFDSLCQEFAPTQEELETYFTEHEADYAQSGITKDGIYVDVRHILRTPEGGTTDENGVTTYSEEEWAACEADAQAILDQWLAGDRTEDSFAALANEMSTDPGSNTNGGLYTDVAVGQMVEPFENWCFDEARVVGDYGLVKTSYGYHVMYFVGSRPVWVDYAENDLINEMANGLLAEVVEQHPIEVDYTSILIGYVNLAG